MRHLVALPVVAGLLAFGGCSTLSGTTTPSVTAPTFAQFLAAVQQDAVLACGFVPTAETVAGLAGAAAAPLALASGIASVVCGAVKAVPTTASLKSFKMKSGHRGVVLPSVDGVPIAGYFVTAK